MNPIFQRMEIKFRGNLPQRLATSSGHDNQRVPSSYDFLNHFLLIWPKWRKPKILLYPKQEMKKVRVNLLHPENNQTKNRNFNLWKRRRLFRHLKNGLHRLHCVIFDSSIWDREWSFGIWRDFGDALSLSFGVWGFVGLWHYVFKQ